MSDGKIRGRPPAGSPDVALPQGETLRGAAKGPMPQGASGASLEPTADFFEHSAAVGARLQDRLQSLSKRTQAGKIAFTNKDIEQLASTFASIIAKNPEADRLKRARRFTEAVLRQKKLKKLFEGLSEREVENMCETIGDVLNDSPVFGQLVDNVTDGASKLGTS